MKKVKILRRIKNYKLKPSKGAAKIFPNSNLLLLSTAYTANTQNSIKKNSFYFRLASSDLKKNETY
jgi:hypothetical protein